MNLSCSHVDEHKRTKGTYAYRLIHAYFVACVAKGSLKKKAKECYCHQCYTVNGRLHACLDCVYLGCYTQHHIHDHAAEAKHYLAVDVIVGKVYCFICEDYMYDPELEAIERKDKILAAQIYGIDYWEPWYPTAEEVKLLKEHRGRTKGVNGTRLGLRGLVNLGNTCFMSSIVQVLTHTPLLRDYFLSDKHDCKFEDTSKCMVCEVSNVFQALYSGDVAPYVPYKLLHLFWSEERNFASSDQQDAHEFYMRILDLLCKHFRGNSSSNEPNRDFGLQCDCIIHQIFAGLSQSDIICPNCHVVTSKTEPFFDIFLDLRTSVLQNSGSCEGVSDVSHDSLVHCLERYTHQEHLDLKRICSSCNSEVDLVIQSTIKKLPVIASFHLKRLEHTWKNSNFISFDECLDMTPYMHFACGSSSGKHEENAYSCLTESDKNFSLFAVVTHIGNKEGGHYVAYIKQHGDDWYLCDDQKLTRVTLNDVLQSEGYLLFYHKRIVEYEIGDDDL